MMRTAFELKIELLKQEVLPECVCRGFVCVFGLLTQPACVGGWRV
mgnify:CR=1 FL=1